MHMKLRDVKDFRIVCDIATMCVQASALFHQAMEV